MSASSDASTGGGSDDAKAYAGAGGNAQKCAETIHVFSVASGHRYERLLRIMMLSVRKNTECPLRLWVVDNFLSPHFRRVLPALGRKVGFAVSTVTYKWPAWLREQTEKQRVIWAYKILFLDVLFPTQVHRILFVDADQIVRADVKELWETNLRGKPYGFVPFCGMGTMSDSSSWGGLAAKLTGGTPEDLRNPDTLGHRFWDQNYWKNTLAGKPYHISALFVVDLERFRKMGAGDSIREAYQSFTADPKNLANLDQDLPNLLQGQIPIHSLPQEWLWCESWCSLEIKSRAKTIDMCQNPVKKEGKLQQAKRIAPEWTEYDAELDRMLAEVEGAGEAD
eukprot:TRINITY_DN26715_c0_g1_i2.p1 TRINITY_DN26715_c0_g1~~TRINITY_DN26715_c0_g1_i2.p1  ORF type:complete len:337 (-),score=91.80 TRINITY_DN26715_c0_g1_i2:143-1153(-)